MATYNRTGAGGTTGHPANGRTPYLVENTIDISAIKSPRLFFDEFFGVDFKKPYQFPSPKLFVPSWLSVRKLSPS